VCATDICCCFSGGNLTVCWLPVVRYLSKVVESAVGWSLVSVIIFFEGIVDRMAGYLKSADNPLFLIRRVRDSSCVGTFLFSVVKFMRTMDAVHT